MATAQGMPRLVYRRGRLDAMTFTPRLGIDTVGRPGQAPGLSTFETVRLRRREKAQGIDLMLLQPPLRGIPDDPAAGGTAGHVSIVPVDVNGNVDQQLLDEWAASRGQSPPHPLTGDVMAAIVQKDVRQQP